MTTTFTPAPVRTAEIRGWLLGLRDLRRDGLALAVRGRPGTAAAPSGDRCFATATAPGRWLVGLVDAHGPGREAAAVARSVTAHLRARAPLLVRGGATLPAILGDANAFARRSPHGRLVSVLLVHVDAPRHTVNVAVAGGVAPAVVGRTGDVVVLGERGPALGLVESARWRETGPVRLARGHLLLATTDGVPDRVRPDGTTFGADAVASILRAHVAESPRSAVRAVLDATDTFAPDDPSDRTAFALRIG